MKNDFTHFEVHIDFVLYEYGRKLENLKLITSISDREFYENLSLDSKRALYPCGSKYLTLDKIQTWEEFENGSECT